MFLSGLLRSINKAHVGSYSATLFVRACVANWASGPQFVEGRAPNTPILGIAGYTHELNYTAKGIKVPPLDRVKVLVSYANDKNFAPFHLREDTFPNVRSIFFVGHPAEYYVQQRFARAWWYVTHIRYFSDIRNRRELDGMPAAEIEAIMKWADRDFVSPEGVKTDVATEEKNAAVAAAIAKYHLFMKNL